MNLIVITDIHGRIGGIHKVFAQHENVDLVILCGDITNFGRKDKAAEIIDEIEKFCPQILAVPGNCDHPEVDHFLNEKKISLHACSKIINGIGFVGAGCSLPCPGTTPNEMLESDFKTILEAARTGLTENSPEILVTHQPPYKTLNDQVGTGFHVGSASIREYINKYQPLICFCGHIHEGIGIDTTGKTKIVNPGPFTRGKYAYTEISDQVEKLEIKSFNN